MKKEDIFVEQLARKADRLAWTNTHENSYSAKIGKCEVTVSHDLLGYIVTLRDAGGDTMITSRKDVESIYSKAQMKALEITEDFRTVLRVLETL